MEDVLKKMRETGLVEKENEDDGGFKPVKGEYICRIDSAGRITGDSKKTGEPYDFRTLKMQVAEIVSGDKATNRFFDRAYNPDEQGTTKLMNDLFTAGIDTKAVNSDTELDEFLGTLKDKTMCVRAWVAPKRKKEGDEWVNVEPKEDVQMIKIVKEFKAKKNPGTAKSSVPF